jgi:hypothetical protein
MAERKIAKRKPKDTALMINGKRYCDLYTDEEWITSINKCYGICNWIARDLKISDHSVYEKLKHNPDLKKVQLDARELMLDKSEEVIIQELEKGNLEAAKFALSRIGRNRGWGEDVNININMQTMNMNLEVLAVEDLNDIREKLKRTIVIEGEATDSA